MIKDTTIMRLIKEVAEELNIDYDLAHDVINTQVDAIEKGIAEGYDKVGVMGFGSFMPRKSRYLKK
jgi:nucleoid DNA-binding protein